MLRFTVLLHKEKQMQRTKLKNCLVVVLPCPPHVLREVTHSNESNPSVTFCHFLGILKCIQSLG